MILNSESIKLKGVADPEQKNLNNVTWEVLEGTAEVDENGVVSVTEDTAVGEKILIMASAPNPNHGKSFDDSVGYVNTEDAVLTDIIELENQFVMPLKSIKIIENSTTSDASEGIHFSGTSFALHVQPSPNNAEYSQVEWEILSGETYGTIDSDGVYNINSSANGSPVTAMARSTVNSGLTSTVTFYPTYSRRQINEYGEDVEVDIKNINIIYNSGSTYIDFYAFGTPVVRYNAYDPNSMFDEYSSLDVTWVIRTAWKKKNDSDSWKSVLTNYEDPGVTGDGNFEKPHFEGNRLWLADDTTNRLQRISIEAQLYGKDDENNPIIVKTRGCTYDFTYSNSDGIVPVTGIKLKNNVNLYSGVLKTTSNGVVFSTNDKNNYPLSGLFEPTDSIYENGVYKTLDGQNTYNFDPNKVQIAHTNGNYTTKLCTLHPIREVRAEYGADGTEEWVASYPIGGEGKYATREWYYDQYNTNLRQIYSPKNRININFNAKITGPDVPVSDVTSIRLYLMGNEMQTTTKISPTSSVTHNQDLRPVVTATTTGTPIPNGFFEARNQSGEVIYNSDGKAIIPIFTVSNSNSADTKTYCAINCFGKELRLYDTGGIQKLMKVKTKIRGMDVEGSFLVKH